MMTNGFMTELKQGVVSHKKQIGYVFAMIAVLAILSVGFHSLFEVEGIVTAKTNKTITVTNFFRTQTVALNNSPVNISMVKEGDQVRINKSLQGDILSIQTENPEHRIDRRHSGERMERK